MSRQQVEEAKQALFLLSLDGVTLVVEENGRLKGEIETLKGRISSAENAGAEVATLREERDLIKTRVTDMIKQLDGLNL